MHTLQDLLEENLWQQYVTLNPQVKVIHRLLRARGEQIVNDHLALRTFGDPRVGLDVMAQPFVQLGYHCAGDYTFIEKKLRARHYEHPDTTQPKIFISELKVEQCSPALRNCVDSLLDQMPSGAANVWYFPGSGRLWKLSYPQYESLRAESEYAAWVAAFGFMANHFTVLVNALKTFDGIQNLNIFLRGHGFKLNTAGGEIKGSPAIFLEQSSTLADKVTVEFSDGVNTIPGCYYEFARRYPLPDGRLYQGFVEKSADKIFQSTNHSS